MLRSEELIEDRGSESQGRGHAYPRGNRDDPGAGVRLRDQEVRGRRLGIDAAPPAPDGELRTEQARAFPEQQLSEAFVIEGLVRTVVLVGVAEDERAVGTLSQHQVDGLVE